MSRDDKKIQEVLKQELDPIYKELAVKLQEPDSVHMPHILARLATLQQARILLMVESPVEEIAEKLGVDKETVENDLQIMFEKGLAHHGRSGWHLTRSWRAARDSVAGSSPKYDDDLFFDLVSAKEVVQRNEQVEAVARGDIPAIRQAMRVLPRWKSIKDIPGVLPYEDVREVFKEAEPIAVLNCPCKKVERHRECKDEIPVETCVVCGRSAQYNIDRGAARKLSREEAVALVESLDDYQLVHTTGNRNTLPTLICNCHPCCCGAFIRDRLAKEKVNQNAVAKSRFIAEEDAEKCQGCRTCVDDRCPVGAIEMKNYPEFDGERAYTDPEECIGCGLCVISCPSEARQMKLVRPPEHIPAPDDQPYAVF